MWRVMGTAAAVVWALAGVANLPRVAHPQTPALVFSVAVSLLVAYWCGTRRARSRATVAAVARAEASALAAVRAETSSQANVAVNLFVPRDGSRSAAVEGQALGLDQAPWMVGRHSRAELDETEVFDTMWEDVGEARSVDGVEP